MRCPFLGEQNVPDMFGTYIFENKLSHNYSSPVEDLRVFTACINPNLPYITCWQVTYSRTLAVSFSFQLDCHAVMAYFELTSNLQDIS